MLGTIKDLCLCSVTTSVAYLKISCFEAVMPYLKSRSHLQSQSWYQKGGLGLYHHCQHHNDAPISAMDYKTDLLMGSSPGGNEPTSNGIWLSKNGV